MPISPSRIPFVGRVREMAELTGALDEALDGRGGLVMLAGEPGIGKTRLIEELTGVARDRGALVTWGTCYEGGSAPPYWPWTQAIRSLLTEPSESVLTALDARAAVMAEIIPEIRDILPDLQPAPDTDPGQARFRLFDSVTSFLNNIAISQPVVLVLDDLHWADRSTLDLLEFVARDVSSKQVLIVGCYRDMELSRRHPLSESLATLARITGFHRILLRGLESDEVARMVETIGNFALPDELVEEIHSRTEGNPFFVSEVTRDMARDAIDRGGDFDALKFRVPEGVREAVGIRLNKLSDECNQLLKTAAVIGREFDFGLLTGLNQKLSEEAQLSLVEEAIAARTVREVPGPKERYEFAHALIQQTLAEEFTTGRRVRLHARIVTAMEELYADHLADHATELLYQCTEAVVGDDKIVFYARLAAERAVAAYAWVEARAYFEQALEAMDDSEFGAVRASVLAGLGEAESLTLNYPDIQRGWDHMAAAFRIYDESGDFESAVALARRSSGFRSMWLHSTESVLSRALEMVEQDSIDAGYLLVQLSGALKYERMDHAGTANALERALEIATGTGNKHLKTRVLRGLAEIRSAEGDEAGASKLMVEVAELARETEQPFEEAYARVSVLEHMIQEGDPGTAAQHIEGVLALEKLFGFRTGILWDQFRIALGSGDMANIQQFGEMIDRNHAGDSVYRILVGLGAWHRGNTSDLDSRFHDAHAEMLGAPTPWQRSSNAAFLALVAWVTGRTDDAIKAGEAALSILSEPRLIPEIEQAARITIALAAIATDDAVQAAEQYQHLAQGRDSLAGTTFYLSGDRILGALANTAGLHDESMAHFEDALIFTSNPSYRLEAAWTGHDYAEALLDRAATQDSSTEPSQNLEKARSVLETSLSVAREIGTRPLEEQLIALQKRAALLAKPSVAYPDGLTEREVEVLCLLAAGSTNQQIADDLVIAPSTAAKHVANILGKTSSANRTEAAAYAAQQGLVESRK